MKKLIVALDRVKKALDKNPQGLSTDDLATICGLTKHTAYVTCRDLFNFQEVVKISTKEKGIFYRLAKHDISIMGSDVAHHGDR